MPDRSPEPQLGEFTGEHLVSPGNLVGRNRAHRVSQYACQAPQLVPQTCLGAGIVGVVVVATPPRSSVSPPVSPGAGALSVRLSEVAISPSRSPQTIAVTLISIIRSGITRPATSIIVWLT
jgi:hypothetical protein